MLRFGVRFMVTVMVTGACHSAPLRRGVGSRVMTEWDAIAINFSRPSVPPTMSISCPRLEPQRYVPKGYI